MSPPESLTPAFVDRILALLAPLFLPASGGVTKVARDAAWSVLADYNPRTDNELRLAALIVAFGFASLDALGRASDRTLSLDAVMDLRDSAVAMSAAGQHNQTMLDRAQRQVRPEPARRKPRANTEAQQDAQARQGESGSRTMH